MSVTQVMEQYQSILEEEVNDIAYKTGAVKRKGKLDAVTEIKYMTKNLEEVCSFYRIEGRLQACVFLR